MHGRKSPVEAVSSKRHLTEASRARRVCPIGHCEYPLDGIGGKKVERQNLFIAGGRKVL